MKALVTVVLVNAAEVLYKPRCWLAKQCLLFMPCSTSVLQHEGSSHSDALAVDGHMPHAIPATVSSSLKRLPACCRMLVLNGVKSVQLLGRYKALTHDQQVQ